MFLADGGPDPVTLGLGVIAGALFFGEFAFFKWIHNPALERADKAIAAAELRHKEEMTEANSRHKAEMAEANARLIKLEEKNDRQNLVLEDKALPALIAATTTVSQFQQLMDSIREEQTRMTRERELEDARRQALRSKELER